MKYYTPPLPIETVAAHAFSHIKVKSLSGGVQGRRRGPDMHAITFNLRGSGGLSSSLNIVDASQLPKNR